MLRILVLHGPNLNMLGTRERSLYGTMSLRKIDATIRQLANREGVRVDIKQSNSEGELVSWIQQAGKRFDGLVINPAALTHTSIAIRDAVSATAIPTVEVHLTNIHAREEFRHRSYTAGVTLGQIVGFGPQSYLLALQALIHHVNPARPS